MDRLKEIINRLEDLGEDKYYTKEELRQLEQHFGRKIAFAFPGWVAFIKADGRHDYFGSFSTKDEDVMIAIAEQRIEGLRQFADKLDACATDEEVMTLCCKVMMDYAMSWKDVDARTDESIRAKRILTDIKSIKVKQGRLAYERSDRFYSCIVLDPYHGSVVIRRTDDGKYRLSDRVPLCGERTGSYDAMHIKGRLVDFMKFIAY